MKNVTGRLLVGLKWFNHIDENGKSVWHFMSFEDQRAIHPTDSNVFWLALFIYPSIWVLIAIATVRARAPVSRLSLSLSLLATSQHAESASFSLPFSTQVLTLHFMWLVLVLVATSLNLINVYGYVKCKRDAGRKLSAIGGSVLTRGFEIWSGAQAKMPSGFTGAAASGSGSRVPVPTEEHV